MTEKREQRAEASLERKREEAKARAQEDKLRAHERPPDEASPRAKSSSHKKVTADKWNQ